MPAARFEIEAVVAPLLHAYVNGAVPLVTVTLALPKLLFAQVPFTELHCAVG